MDAWRVLFICSAVTTAGVAQVFWLKSALSRRFMSPVDFGLHLRGQRVFGDNKTWRGFIGMIPACALSFAAWSFAFPHLWQVQPLGYLGLGAACGLGFMAGELPNSFIKRQLDVAPGQPPKHAFWRRIAWIVDRFDSLIGGLLAITALVPMNLSVWIGCLIVGPAVHASLSYALFKAGVKKRAG